MWQRYSEKDIFPRKTENCELRNETILLLPMARSGIKTNVEAENKTSIPLDSSDAINMNVIAYVRWFTYLSEVFLAYMYILYPTTPMQNSLNPLNNAPNPSKDITSKGPLNFICEPTINECLTNATNIITHTESKKIYNDLYAFLLIVKMHIKGKKKYAKNSTLKDHPVPIIDDDKPIFCIISTLDTIWSNDIGRPFNAIIAMLNNNQNTYAGHILITRDNIKVI